ncbi:MAG TPA: CsbD family protein [Polyangiaceae bacterium]|nr:CsbD family protein [Polyangiaceae bacterium]
MSNASKRSEGAAEETGGKIKEVVGKVVGSERMEAEGRARKLEGQAKQESAKAAERATGKAQQAVGAIKNRVGALIGDDELQAKGKVKELEGEARERANR